jgi:hypothetical protein
MSFPTPVLTGSGSKGHSQPVKGTPSWITHGNEWTRHLQEKQSLHKKQAIVLYSLAGKISCRILASGSQTP